MNTLAGIISLISLIVFFVMAYNIGTLVSLTRVLREQNFKIIDLLRRSVPSEYLTDQDKAKIMEAMKK